VCGSVMVGMAKRSARGGSGYKKGKNPECFSIPIPQIAVMILMTVLEVWSGLRLFGLQDSLGWR
jgi:hypothetical protein